MIASFKFANKSEAASYYQNHKDHIGKSRIILYNKRIQNKQYNCDRCDKAYRDKAGLDRHLNSKKHNGTYIRYCCSHEGCNYSNPSRFHLDVHLISRKHIAAS